MNEIAVLLLVCFLGASLMPLALTVIGSLVAIPFVLLETLIERWNAWAEKREPRL